MCNGQGCMVHGAVQRGGCSDNAVTVAAAVISDQMMAADIIHRAPVISNNNTDNPRRAVHRVMAQCSLHFTPTRYKPQLETNLREV